MSNPLIPSIGVFVGTQVAAGESLAANTLGIAAEMTAPSQEETSKLSALTGSALEAQPKMGLGRFAQVRANGDGSAKKVHVSADFTGVDHLFYRKVRQKGIYTRADIKLALDYLSELHPSIRKLLLEFEKKQIPIAFGEEDLTYSYAKPTFHSRIDRTAPDFGKGIVIQKGATPDILFHEILHCLPLSLIQKLLPFDIVLPPVNPYDSFATLRSSILQHMRVNEAISFSGQGYFYQMERSYQIFPIFNALMMDRLDSAYREGGFNGVMATFPQVLPHYEEREGLNSVLLSLIAKVEGRLTLEWREVEQKLAAYQTEFRGEAYLRYFQDYLNRYVRDRKLDCPPDFYSLEEIIKRAGIALWLNDKGSTEQLVALIDSLFGELEALERGQFKIEAARPLPPLKILSFSDIPPEVSHADRQQIFAAYSNLVERVIDNPPGSLSHEELAALVSYARMVSPSKAIELTERLNVYLGAGHNDLRVVLGLILCDKGFKEEGEAMVSKYLSPKQLRSAYRWVLKIMGPDFLVPFLERYQQVILEEDQKQAESFRTAALGQYNWESPLWRSAAEQLFSHPKLVNNAAWSWFGGWLFENGEVDTHLPDSELLNFSEEMIENNEFLHLLWGLRKKKKLDPGLENVVNRIWEEHQKKMRGRYASLLPIFKLSGETHFLDSITTMGEHFRFYSVPELEAIFQDYPAPLKKKAVTLAQLFGKEGWAYPKTAALLLKEAYKLATLQEQEVATKIKIWKFWLEAVARRRGPLPKEMAVEIKKRIEAGLKENKPWPRPKVLEVQFWKDYFREQEQFAASVFPLLWGLQLFPEESGVYIKRAWEKLKSDFDQFERDSNADVNLVDAIDFELFPAALYLLDTALQRGEEEMAKAISDFLFREIPKQFPSDRKHQWDPAEERDGDSTWKDRSIALKSLASTEWKMEMEGIRRNTLKSTGNLTAWFKRMQAELYRGGETITIEALRYYSDNLIREERIDLLPDLYRMMILKSLMALSPDTIAITLKAIQKSPLPDAAKDDLLEELSRRLLDLAQGFQGVDLSMVHHLRGLFPWRTPFMKPKDLPHYPKTEQLLVERLSKIPELVNPERGKDERLRLAVFAAAGLPLQRFASWQEQSSAPTFLARDLEGERGFYQKQGLPHPIDIPLVWTTVEADTFLTRNRKNVRALLKEGSMEEQKAVVRLLGRMLGSERRALRDKNAGNSSMAIFLIDWAKEQYGAAAPSPLLPSVLDHLFSQGPQTQKYLKIGLEMMQWRIHREAKRDIFERATQDIFYGKRVKKQIEIFRGQKSGEQEEAYYRLLLGIDYKRHPRNMPTDFFLQRLEKDRLLQQDYRLYLAGKKSRNPILLAETGLADIDWLGQKGRDWLARTPIERLEIYINALGFLKTYLSLLSEEEAKRWEVNADYFEFSSTWVGEHFDHFRPYLKSRVSNTEEITVDQDHVFTDVSTEIREMAELLAVAGWGKKMEEYLDALHDESAAARGVGEGDVREWNEYGDFWREEEVSEVVEDSKKSPKPKTDISASKKKELLNTLGGAKREAEEILKKWILGNLELQIEEAGIPSFIEKRKGLEKELLTYLLASISPANRVVLERQLQKSKKDADRLLLLGRASHLEKLLQLASIHPLVPEQYQKMFAIFQEEVPPRDPIDARRTLEMHLAGGELEKFDVDFTAPLKEGTIAGVYRATYGREPVVLKLIPEGKEKDLRDSLRIVREMRRYLKAGNYKTAGSQAVDDLLVFYEVTMIEELDLGGDIFHAKEIAAILPKGFAVPKYLENVSAPPVMAAMRPAYSRRLKDLSPAERERVFKKVDEELIPAMMAGGVFHYDLHPGNMGLMENGDIILYDTGRVHKMSEEEKKRLTDLYINLLHKRSTEDLKETLRSMGEVWDKKLFEGIDVLLREWIENRDPLGAFEKIYSRFADYGFRLGDSYVKLLFMYITWEGTKRSLA